MMKVLWMCVAVVTVALFATGPAQAGVADFSDLDVGLSDGDQDMLAADYATGLPDGISATWTGFMWKKTAGPADHTADNDDNMQLFGADVAADIAFSSPLIVSELWMHKTSWGSTGDWTVIGSLGGEEQWSATVTAADVWSQVTEGTGVPIDALSFPDQSQWNHVDDITFEAVPEPSKLALLAMAGIAAMVMRKRRRLA